MGGGGSKSTSKQEQIQRSISKVVSDVVSKSSADTNVHTTVDAHAIQNLEVEVHDTAVLVCLSGIEFKNEVRMALKSNASIFNKVHSGIEQRVSESVSQMLTQMVDSHAAERGRGGSGFTLPLFGGGFGSKGGSANDQRIETEIRSTVSNSVHQSIQSFVNMRKEMRAGATQNLKLHIRGTMVSFGKCKFDNTFVSDLVANTVAKNVVDGLLKSELIRSTLENQTPGVARGVGSALSLDSIGDWVPIFFIGGAVLLLVLVFSREGRGSSGDDDE